ncbi:MAG: hypothetical protein E7157_01550 [Lactobacillales bacterium]|nr:hypothetical protein [Lactobacillales bacterium]
MEKKIPKKNYIIVILISVFTILLTFFLMNKYNSNKTIENITFVSEIKENELNNYVTERQEVIIYMSSSTNENIKDLESDLEKYTKKKNLKDEYVYLDLSKVNSNFYNEFYINYLNESYSGKFKIEEPTIVIIRNGKVESYLNKINNINQIKLFFEKNGVLE